MPSKIGSVEIAFNTIDKMGHQVKTITVVGNTVPNSIELTISGEVVP